MNPPGPLARPLPQPDATGQDAGANWRPLMGEAPTDELLGWLILVPLAFGPLILWVLASLAREFFA